MKTIKLFSLAALLMAGAAFTACSSDNDILDEQQTVNANGQYKLTIKAGKAATRALAVSGDNIAATWTADDEVSVYNETKDEPLIGSLVAQSSGAETTLTGELEGTIEPGDELTLEYCSPTYYEQDGTLAYIAANCDYAKATVVVKSVSDGNIVPEDATTTFVNQQAIIKFTLQDKENDAAINPSALTVNGSGVATLEEIPATTYTTNGDGVVYVAYPATGEPETIKLTATVGTATYIYETATAKTFTNGQYYAITVKMTNPLTVPLTIEALMDGSSITVSSPKSGMKYSTDGGMNKYEVSDIIVLEHAGDKVQFYGNTNSYNGTNIGGSGYLKVYGNIMSLVNEENFSTDYNTLPANSTFSYLFKNNTYLTDASGLLLPATTLKRSCYKNMFEGCTSLTAGPTLPATTLENSCYAYMFKNCTSLTSLTCLATNISASFCISIWLNGVSTEGILYVDPTMTEASWGIPSNWTVKSVAEKP